MHANLIFFQACVLFRNTEKKPRKLSFAIRIDFPGENIGSILVASLRAKKAFVIKTPWSSDALAATL